MSVTVVSSTNGASVDDDEVRLQVCCRGAVALLCDDHIRLGFPPALGVTRAAVLCWLLAMFATVALAAPTSACTESLQTSAAAPAIVRGVPDSAPPLRPQRDVALQPADTGLPQADSSTIAWSWAWVSAEPS